MANHTVTIDGAVRARLFAIALNLLAAAFVTGASHSSSFLDGLGWRVDRVVTIVVFIVRLGAERWRWCVVGLPVVGRRLARVVLGDIRRHFRLDGVSKTMAMVMAMMKMEALGAGRLGWRGEDGWRWGMKRDLALCT